MFNLAALRYRDVLAEHGGPVARLTCGETSVLGERWFEAGASLREDLRAGSWARRVWGSVDGSGTDRSPLVARFKAISEALERWAHLALHRDPAGARHGFDVDPSSNGLAAFPGLLARQARAAALTEAVERFNLLHWWEGGLGAVPVASPWPGVDAVVIESDTPGVTVVVHRESARGFHAYGHACGRDLRAACLKAAVELERHDAVVRHWALVRAGAPACAAELDAMHPIDRRALHFATDEGHARFRERVAEGRRGPRAVPRLVCDGRVPGPWDRWAPVWRVVFAPPSLRFLSREPDYFLW